MELTATIAKVFAPVSGTSRNGNPYTTQTVVVTYGERYPKELALTLMTRQAEEYGQFLAVGQQLKFFFEASSREYNGKYYTECTVWKIESIKAQNQAAPVSDPAPMPSPAPQPQQQQPYTQQQYAQPQHPAPPTQPQMPNYGPQYGAPAHPHQSYPHQAQPQDPSANPW